MTPPRGAGPASRVQVYASLEAASDATARAIVAAAGASVAARGRFTLVLSGGESPRLTYELLASRYAAKIAWHKTDVFFSDERCVPPSDHRNNFAMTRDAFLSRVPLDADHIHAIPTVGAAPEELARRYEENVRTQLGAAAAADAPTFDFVLLGAGADGHTASLFPGDTALREPERWVLAVQAPPGIEVRDRITLTLPALNRSRRVTFLVAGDAKRKVLDRILGPDTNADGPLPAALVHGVEATDWILDDAAGAGRGSNPQASRPTG